MQTIQSRFFQIHLKHFLCVRMKSDYLSWVPQIPPFLLGFYILKRTFGLPLLTHFYAQHILFVFIAIGFVKYEHRKKNRLRYAHIRNICTFRKAIENKYH